MLLSGSFPKVIEQVKLAGEYHIESRWDEAEAMLRSIDHPALRREYDESKARAPKGSWSRSTIERARRHSPNVSALTKFTLFKRDKFMCRYCGRKTLYNPTLRVLSLLYPSALPYHTHGKFTECHFIYWTYVASAEHTDPRAHGGDSKLGNLVTTCYLCNHRKNSARLEDLNARLDDNKWELLPEPTTGQWDGLWQMYRDLYSLCPDAKLSITLRESYRAVSQ